MPHISRFYQPVSCLPDVFVVSFGAHSGELLKAGHCGHMRGALRLGLIEDKWVFLSAIGKPTSFRIELSVDQAASAPQLLSENSNPFRLILFHSDSS